MISGIVFPLYLNLSLPSEAPCYFIAICWPSSLWALRWYLGLPDRSTDRRQTTHTCPAPSARPIYWILFKLSLFNSDWFDSKVTSWNTSNGWKIQPWERQMPDMKGIRDRCVRDNQVLGKENLFLCCSIILQASLLLCSLMWEIDRRIWERADQSWISRQRIPFNHLESWGRK